MKFTRRLFDPAPVDAGVLEIPADLNSILNPTVQVERGTDQNATPVVPKVEVAKPADKPTIADVLSKKGEVVAPPEKELTSADIITQSLLDSKAAQQVDPNKPAEAAPVTAPVTGRDFSGIDPTDQVLFKNMSNEAFTKLKPMYAEHKQLRQDVVKLKQERDELSVKAQAANEYKTVLDHDQGYLLTPEFATAMQAVNNLESEENFYAQQLEKIEKGEEFQYLYQNDKGEIYRGALQKPTSADKVQMGRLMARAMQLKATANGNLQAFQHKHNARRAEVNTALRGASQTFFPYLAGIEAQKEHKYHSTYQEAVSMVPLELRAHPLVDVLAKAWVVVKVQNELVNNLKKASGAKADSQAGGPNGSIENTSAVAPKIGEIVEPPSFDKLQKFMQGGVHPLTGI